MRVNIRLLLISPAASPSVAGKGSFVKYLKNEHASQSCAWQGRAVSRTGE